MGLKGCISGGGEGKGAPGRRNSRSKAVVAGRSSTRSGRSSTRSGRSSTRVLAGGYESPGENDKLSV